MKPTMTFSEFTSGEATSENAMLAMAAAKELKKKQNEGSSCMSETMHEKMHEMYEAMCKEMKDIHEDASEMTAESYHKEASTKLTEMMEKLSENAMLYKMAYDKAEKRRSNAQ